MFLADRTNAGIPLGIGGSGFQLGLCHSYISASDFRYSLAKLSIEASALFCFARYKSTLRGSESSRC